MFRILLFLFLFIPGLFAQKKDIPPDVSLKMYIGALVSDHGLTSGLRYREYYTKYVSPIASSVDYGRTFSNIVSYQRQKGKEFLTAKKIYGAFRNMLSTNEVKILIGLSIHENEDEEFVDILKQVYMGRMDNLLFVDDSVGNSSSSSGKPITFSGTMNLGDELSLTFTYGKDKEIYVKGNHRKYVDILKHCFRQIVKDYSLRDYNVEIKWEPVKGKTSYLRSPLEIYMTLIKIKTLNETYFGDFDYSGKTRSWGLMHENFQMFMDSGDKKAFIPVDDYQNLKELSLLFGKSNVIQKQFIGVQNLNDITSASGRSLNDKAIALYSQNLLDIRSGKLKGSNILNAMDKVLAIQPNHLSAKIYKELLQKKYVTRMSLMNSFFEFERIYGTFKRQNFFDSKNPVESTVKSSIENDSVRLYKVAHPSVMAMVKHIQECMKTIKQYGGTSSDAIKKGFKQKFYKSIRSLHTKRDLLIDNQAAIDRIYKK